jgi:hypothetical protein
MKTGPGTGTESPESPPKTPDQLEIEFLNRQIGEVIGRAVEQCNENRDRKIGFALMLFDFGEGGYISYVSNADRKDIMLALAEMLEKFMAEHEKENPWNPEGGGPEGGDEV